MQCRVRTYVHIQYVYVPWKVQPLLLQVSIQSFHDLVKELHASLQLLKQVGHLGGFKHLCVGGAEQRAGAGQENEGGAVKETTTLGSQTHTHIHHTKHLRIHTMRTEHTLGCLTVFLMTSFQFLSTCWKSFPSSGICCKMSSEEKMGSRYSHCACTLSHSSSVSCSSRSRASHSCTHTHTAVREGGWEGRRTINSAPMCIKVEACSTTHSGRQSRTPGIITQQYKI